MKNLEQLVTAINNTNGKIFSVTFIRRSGGKRKMLCRLGVTKYLRGGVCPYDFDEKNLISVFDLQENEYRTIPFEGICSAKIGGVEYIIKNEELKSDITEIKNKNMFFK
jgi:hypothetical protein